MFSLLSRKKIGRDRDSFKVVLVAFVKAFKTTKAAFKKGKVVLKGLSRPT